jgi:hypothetical protein
MLAEVFGISRQAYYQRENRILNYVKQKDIILELIKPFRKRMYRLGSVKLYGKVKEGMDKMNIKMGRDKFLDLLREENMLIRKKKNFTKTTNSFHRFRKYKNLIKGLVVKRPEEVWVSDITYIKTDQGHEYLSLITDYYSKKIVGYHLADNLKTESTLKALEMAIKSRKYANRKLIHHSDRCFQYCDGDYIAVLNHNGIRPSMTEVYDPYENAIAEYPSTVSHIFSA